MKIVYDTNTLVSATIWEGSFAHKSLASAIVKDKDFIVSIEILDEYSEVLLRDFKYSKTEVNNIIIFLFHLFHIVYPKIKFNAVEDDPDDNMILDCAVEGKADYREF